jgi:hypothetical protein
LFTSMRFKRKGLRSSPLVAAAYAGKSHLTSSRKGLPPSPLA